MKIILIQPPFNSNCQPHLGLAYLTSILKKEDHDVTQMDINLEITKSNCYGKLLKIQDEFKLNNVSDDNKIFLENIFNNYLEKILNEKPDIVGFTISTYTIYFSLYLTRKIKKLNPNIKILFGGLGLMYVHKKIKEYIASSGVVDYIIEGEGEFALIELLNQIDKGTKNLSIKKEINDINNLPFPEFEESDIKKSRYPHILPMILSRGCIGKCTFCIEKLFWEGYRIRDISNIIEEFKTQKDKYNIDNFWLHDSLLNGDMNFFSDFCDRLIKENLKLYWGGNIRIHPKLTEEFCKKMYRAGCRFLRIGIESGSQKVLNHMRKGISIDNAQDIIKNIYNADIYTHTYIMVGYPTEKNEDFLKTFNFLLSSNNLISSFYVHKFSLYRKLLGKENPLYSIEENSNLTKNVRHDILKLFVNSFTDIKQYQEFFNIKDFSDYKNKKVDKKIFTRALIINNKYYGYNEEIELNEDNYLKLNEISNININDKKIFVTTDNNFDKTKKIPNNNDVVFTKPIPGCIIKNFESKATLKSCDECMEFLKINNDSIIACKKQFNLPINIKDVKDRCKNCIYLKRNQCFPCYYIIDDTCFIKV